MSTAKPFINPKHRSPSIKTNGNTTPGKHLAQAVVPDLNKRKEIRSKNYSFQQKVENVEKSIEPKKTVKNIINTFEKSEKNNDFLLSNNLNMQAANIRYRLEHRKQMSLQNRTKNMSLENSLQNINLGKTMIKNGLFDRRNENSINFGSASLLNDIKDTDNSNVANKYQIDKWVNTNNDENNSTQNTGNNQKLLVDLEENFLEKHNNPVTRKEIR